MMGATYPLRAAAIALVLAGCAGRQTPAPVELRDTTAASAAAAHTVVVGSGETVYDIAKRYHVSLRALIERNKLTPPYNLVPGTQIVLPRPTRYTVERGDTLYGISRRFGVDMSTLVRHNKIPPPYRIQVGQVLNVPGSVDTTAPQQTVSPAAPAPQGAVEARSLPDIPPPPAEAGTPQPPTESPAETPEAPPRGTPSFRWPVRGQIIVGFGSQGRGLHNDGINIAVSRGAEIRAAAGGVVAYAGNELRGFGNLLLIKHPDGWTTAYAHNDELLVGRGDQIRQGQVIARAGSTGNVATPQLHFELRKGQRAVDPQRYLAVAAVPSPLKTIAGRAVPPNPG